MKAKVVLTEQTSKCHKLQDREVIYILELFIFLKEILIVIIVNKIFYPTNEDSLGSTTW